MQNEIKENLNFINEIIEAHKDNKQESIILTTINIEAILKISKELNSLKEIGITTQNFSHKAKSFLNHIATLKEEFNYNISVQLPFNNPSNIKIKLDNYLQGLNLNNSQISEVSKEVISNNVRRPRKKDIEPSITTYIKNNKTNIKSKAKYITPLSQEEYNKKFDKNNNPAIVQINLSVKELKLLDTYIKQKYDDYYIGSFELYLQDQTNTLIKQLS